MLATSATSRIRRQAPLQAGGCNVVVGSNNNNNNCGGKGDARSLQIRIQEYKERNSVVARTINELHQEVSDTLEERIALEFQLEQLKSFGE